MDTLGVIVFFSFPNWLEANAEVFNGWIAELGLDVSTLPPLRGSVMPTHAYRYASRNATTTYPMPWVSETTHAKVRLLEVARGPLHITNHLTREMTTTTQHGLKKSGVLVVDRVGQSVLHRRATTVRAMIRTTPGRNGEAVVHARERPLLEALLRAHQEAYHAALTVHHSKTLRMFVYKYLSRVCEAVYLRERGGVYYIPAQHVADAQRLGELVDRIAPDVWWMLPMPDEPRNRAIIAAHQGQGRRSGP